MFVQKAHRLGVLRRERFRGVWSKSRPIIICFGITDSRYAYKLMNTKMGIYRDYPKEIVNARSELRPRYKEEKEKHPTANVSIG